MATSHNHSLPDEIISKLRPTGRLIEPRIKLDEPPVGTNMARELMEGFKLHSDRVLLVDAATRSQWTGGQLLETCGRIATGLIKQVQVRPDDVVMTICEHTGAEILAALGIVLAGGALFGTSPQDGYSELEVNCQLVQPNVIIVSSRQHQLAAKLRHNVTGLAQTRIVWLDNPMKHSDSGIVLDLNNNNNNIDANNNNNNNIDANNNNLDDSIESIMDRDQVILFDELINGQFDQQLIDSVASERIVASEHMLTYMLTSGSTGRPKVVPSTHEELIYGLYSMISATRYPVVGHGLELDPNTTGPGHHLLPIGPHSVVAGDLPLDHGAGLNTMLLTFRLGAKYIVMPSYEVDSFWQAVNDYKITTSIASTTFGYKLFRRLKQLIEQNNCKDTLDGGGRNVSPGWDLSSLQFITCCGAKMAYIELIREVQSVYEHIHVSQSFGCTEIGFISLVPASESLDDHYLESTGYLMPGVVAKVVDNSEASSGQLMGPMERGELLVWARSKFKGYRCHPSDDRHKIYANCHDEQGFFYRTGDQAHYDNEGRIYIHGRFKDTLCLMEDWKILPAELEVVIDLHPLVEQSVVIGVPDLDLPGCHKPRAFCKLIPKSGPHLEQLDDAELRNRLLENDLDYISQHIYNFMADRTARPKHLTGGVRILDDFPRVGLLRKVDRKALTKLD